MTISNNELGHIGIPGMRWGVRRGSSSSGGGSKTSNNSPDHLTAVAIKKKKVSEMSNDEIRTLTSRMQLEKQYKDLNPSKIAKGKKLVGELLLTAGKTKAQELVTKYLSRGADKYVVPIIDRALSAAVKAKR